MAPVEWARFRVWPELVLESHRSTTLLNLRILSNQDASSICLAQSKQLPWKHGHWACSRLCGRVRCHDFLRVSRPLSSAKNPPITPNVELILDACCVRAFVLSTLASDLANLRQLHRPWCSPRGASSPWQLKCFSSYSASQRNCLRYVPNVVSLTLLSCSHPDSSLGINGLLPIALAFGFGITVLIHNIGHISGG